ncbi:MAG TPA: RNA polymerase sigma factor RpoH [Woeseiaceae bacterium]|nr:RNA polymerase sigma factor RpoH [Woeseiaceae bacterium]
MSNTNVTALPVPLSNLSQYLQLVETFPRLKDDEERALAERLKQDHDLDAARTLILSHLRYVVYIARGYTGYGLPQEDLIQEGNVGLMKAVRRFDPARGVRLVAYACYWIRAHIHDFILKNWRMVKVTTTKSRRKLFYKLRSAKQRLDWLNRDEAKDIARSLGVDAEEVIEMEAQMYVPDQPFDVPSEEFSDDTRSLSDYLEDTGTTPDQKVAQDQFLCCASSALHDALRTLDTRSRDIIESRWLNEDPDKPTLQSLGERYGVSAERIRQLEVAAISQLREMMVPRLGVDYCDVELPRQQSLFAF